MVPPDQTLVPLYGRPRTAQSANIGPGRKPRHQSKPTGNTAQAVGIGDYRIHNDASKPLIVKLNVGAKVISGHAGGNRCTEQVSLGAATGGIN